MSSWKEVHYQYSVTEKIGAGSYGEVYKATCLLSGQTVAIKHMKGFGKYDYDCVKLVREV